MYEFDEDTQIVATGEATWRCEMSDRWNIGAVPNGGYVMSIGYRGLEEMLQHPDLLTLSGHYVRPTRPGLTELLGELVHVGKSTSMGMLKLLQDGKECVRFLATAGHFADDGSVEDRHASGPPAEIPELSECFRLPMMPGVMPAISARFETHHAPVSSEWMRGKTGTVMASGGYTRFSDGRPPDLSSLPLFADGFSPTLFNVLGQPGWVPTLQLNLQFRARPVDGFLRAWFVTRHLTGGLHEEDGELWDADGKLVALSRQLARIRLPKRSQ